MLSRLLARHNFRESRSAVDHITIKLRASALGVEPGTYLGSEATLSRRFGVSGPTFRQAARLLEHEEVIEIRRGLHGGYFASRPKLETVVRVAATFVRGNPSSIDEFWTLVEALAPFIIDLAIKSGRISDLEPFTVPFETEYSDIEFIEQESRFVETLWGMMGNTPLEMILWIFSELGFSVALQLGNRIQSDKMVVDRRIALAKSLLENNRDDAVRYFCEYQKIVLEDFKSGLSICEEMSRNEWNNVEINV
jgi:GntR family transcriptional regulator, transcriptional repressor for pyruvate dehydrogenase complex